MNRLAIIGDFDINRPTHRQTVDSLAHVYSKFDIPVESEWISSSTVCPEILSHFGGVLVAPGPPYVNLDRVLEGIKFAREHNLPLLGTCQGFQSIILEYARNVLGVPHADHEEYNSSGSELVITKQACSLAGLKMQVSIDPESNLSNIYKSTTIQEKYYCTFCISPEYEDRIKYSTLKAVGTDQNGEVRIVQLLEHPFYVGTLFVPQANSTQEVPHPLIKKFLEIIYLRGST